jgi:hypothetical protein
MPRKKKVTVINEHGEEIEEEFSDDDESIVDPISDSRCTTPGLFSPDASGAGEYIDPFDTHVPSPKHEPGTAGGSGNWSKELDSIVEEK